MQKHFYCIFIIPLFLSCCKENIKVKILPVLPEGVQAISLLGDTLKTLEFPKEIREEYEQKLDLAKVDFERNPNDADAVIWYGRRMAYLGEYRKAIKIFSEGIKKHPKDARMYRHRGHHYISIREFGKAIEDYKIAVSLINGTEDIIEPDGMPNAKNIPVSTLRTNIWYHLGLAYYLKHDLNNALQSYRKGIEACTNDDILVAFTHWYYIDPSFIES